MTTHIRTAIFPVAGLGTRFLPATKATPKELLPVIDTPLIQYAIDEVLEAGIERLIFVSHPSKPAIERYVMEDRQLGKDLRARGKIKLADALQQTALSPVEDDALFINQPEPLGLGHAVLCAKRYVLPGAVAVILPDDLILGRKGALSEMVEAYGKTEAGHMVATMQVPQEETQKYGVLDVSGRSGRLTHAKGMVEKPNPQDAPSCDAVVGRYILDAKIFDALETCPPGAGGEIQLTDAIAAGVEDLGLCGFSFSGQRFDCGSKKGMLEAILHVAEQDDEYAEVLAGYRPPMQEAYATAAE